MEASNSSSLFSDSRKECTATRFYYNGCTLLPILVHPLAMLSTSLRIQNFLLVTGHLESPLVHLLTPLMVLVVLLGQKGSIIVRRLA